MEEIRLEPVTVTCMNLGKTCNNKTPFKIKVMVGTKPPRKMCHKCQHKDDGTLGDLSYPSHWSQT